MIKLIIVMQSPTGMLYSKENRWSTTMLSGKKNLRNIILREVRRKNVYLWLSVYISKSPNSDHLWGVTATGRGKEVASGV